MRNATKKRSILCATAAVAILALLGGCVEVGIPADGDKPWGELNPARGMHEDPAYSDQEPQPNFRGGPPSMRVPPPNTVPVDRQVYRYHDAADEAGALVNPVPINEETLRYGQLAYQSTCMVCHGEDGRGSGPVVGEQKYPEPPSLTTQRAQNFTDGDIFHIVTHGTGRMWGYDNQLYPSERWAVVNYLRALQRADSPRPQDLEFVTER
jgi:mono/diheme cytochrome c family protein